MASGLLLAGKFSAAYRSRGSLWPRPPVSPTGLEVTCVTFQDCCELAQGVDSNRRVREDPVQECRRPRMQKGCFELWFEQPLLVQGREQDCQQPRPVLGSKLAHLFTVCDQSESAARGSVEVFADEAN